jgi:hypothetical protein
VQFFVLRKPARRGIPKTQRVPHTVHVSLRVGGKRVRRALPTDVIHVCRFVPTGCLVGGFQGGPVTAGAVISWGLGAAQRWGLVTVGHAFGGDAGLVDVAIAGAPPFRGALFSRAPDGVPVDAAVVEVRLADLQSVPGLMPPPGSPPLAVRSVSQIGIDVSRDDDAGRTLRADGPRAFDSIGFTPGPVPFGEGLKPLVDVLLVRSTAGPDAFPRGTSGSVWMFTGPGVASAMQFGGRPPSFTDGAGQAILTVLLWAKGEVGASGFHLWAVF